MFNYCLFFVLKQFANYSRDTLGVLGGPQGVKRGATWGAIWGAIESVESVESVDLLLIEKKTLHL